MDRFALFVDAGYIHAAASIIFHGTPDRTRSTLAPTLPAAIAERCAAEVGLPHLRTYWYDAAENLVPTASHLEMARQTRVKLRLGRLTRSGQKGVDSLIMRDMVRLASEHAIATAVVVTGDEDLRAAVAESQDYGVEVILVVVETPENGSNVSRALLREVDDVVALNRDFLVLHVQQGVHVEANQAGEVSQPAGAIYQFGHDFGLAWRSDASADEVAALAERYPYIPGEIDRELLQQAAIFTDLAPDARFDFPAKKNLRGGFWSAIDEVSAPEVEDARPGG